MDGYRTGGCMHRWTDVMDGWTDRLMGRQWTDRWMDEWVHKWTDMNGFVDEYVYDT